MKRLARGLTPPVLWRAASQLKQLVVAPPPKRFRGVFDSFSQVPDERPWSRPGYLDASRQLLRECQAGLLPPKSETTHALLAFIVNTLPTGTIPSVLDWAGGTGIRYWTLQRALNRPVRWQVVDSAPLAALSREVMGISEELTFSEDLPAAPAAFDLVIVYSSLQYVEAQDDLLTRLAACRPRYLVMPRLMARTGRGYVTRQDVFGFSTPCKVSSVEHITMTMRSQGYEPVLAIEDGLDLSTEFAEDVPPDLRVGKERLLVFRRSPDA